MTRRPALPPRTGPAISLAEPQAGFWLMRLVKGGPLVPASIRADENSELHAFILGKLVGIDRVWGWQLGPITKAEHDFLLADYRWAMEHDPDSPIANPKKRIVLTDLEPILP